MMVYPPGGSCTRPSPLLSPGWLTRPTPPWYMQGAIVKGGAETHTWPELNLTTGPVEMSERTLREGVRPILYHYDPAFLELFERTCALLQRVYGTSHDVVIMQGEALLGLEAAAASLIAPATQPSASPAVPGCGRWTWSFGRPASRSLAQRSPR